MKIPTFASSYHDGNGLESRDFQSGVYLPIEPDIKAKIIVEINEALTTFAMAYKLSHDQ